MPFTGAHPLAVLPLIHVRRLDATCLVVGSMSPDLLYFARGELAGTFGHTKLGLALWCVPSTLVVAVLVHFLIKWPALLVVPAPVARRAVGVVDRPWPKDRSVATLLLLPISAAIGAVTHLVWDSFTHAKGFFVQQIGFLRAELQLPVLGETVVHRVLQLAFSVIGLAVLSYVIVRYFRRAPVRAVPDVPRSRARWIFAGSLALGVGLLFARLVAMNAFSVGDLIVGPISGAMVGTLLASVLLRREAKVLR
jgi:hypothetical protein